MTGGRLRVVGPGVAPGSTVTPADLAANQAADQAYANSAIAVYRNLPYELRLSSTATDVEIQAALDAVGVAGGGRVILPSDSLTCANPIFIRYPYVALEGQGHTDTTLNFTNATGKNGVVYGGGGAGTSTITSAAYSSAAGGTYTYTTGQAHGLRAGQRVLVYENSVSAYNTSTYYFVAATPSATTFTVTGRGADPGGSATGGRYMGFTWDPNTNVSGKLEGLKIYNADGGGIGLYGNGMSHLYCDDVMVSGDSAGFNFPTVHGWDQGIYFDGALNLDPGVHSNRFKNTTVVWIRNECLVLQASNANANSFENFKFSYCTGARAVRIAGGAEVSFLDGQSERCVGHVFEVAGIDVLTRWVRNLNILRNYWEPDSTIATTGRFLYVHGVKCDALNVSQNYLQGQDKVTHAIEVDSSESVNAYVRGQADWNDFIGETTAGLLAKTARDEITVRGKRATLANASTAKPLVDNNSGAGAARVGAAELYKSGAGVTISDADYTADQYVTAPPDGTTGSYHDTTSGKSYRATRMNGTWKGVQLT